METAELLEFTRMTGAVVKALRECPLPVIAAINGVAAGAGSVIALASDFRLLAAVGVVRLPLHAGRPRPAPTWARPTCCRGSSGSAARPSCSCSATRSTRRARPSAIGLATQVVDDDELPDGGAALARRLADGPALAYSTTKVMLTRELDMSLAQRDRDGGADAGAAHADERPPRVLRARGARAASRSGAGDEQRDRHRARARAAGRLRARRRRRAGGRTVYLGGQTALGRRRRRSSARRSPSSSTSPPATSSRRCAPPAARPRTSSSLQIFVTDVAGVQGVADASSARSGSGTSGAHYPAIGLFGVTRAVRRRGAGRADGRRRRARRPMTRDHRAATSISTQDAASTLLLSARGGLARESWRRSPRAGTPGQLNRPLVAALGEHGLLSRLARRGDDVRALELCLIREGLARGTAPRPRPRSPCRGSGRIRSSQSARRTVVADWLPRRGRRRGGRRLRAHRARCRLRRRRRSSLQADAATGTATASPARRSGSPTPRTPTSTPSSRARRGTGAGASPRSPSRATARASAASRSTARPPHPIGRLIFDGVPVPADACPRRGRPGLQGRHADARPLSPERRRVRGRHGAGGARRGRRARRRRARRSAAR